MTMYNIAFPSAFLYFVLLSVYYMRKDDVSSMILYLNEEQSISIQIQKKVYVRFCLICLLVKKVFIEK